MALDNFIGQNIQDTFQRVVQTEGGVFADGTGSVLNIITSNQTASFLTNSDTASFLTEIPTGTYSSSLQTLSNITASGDLSVSGDGTFGGNLSIEGGSIFSLNGFGITIDEILIASGSTQFGSLGINTHGFTGSINVSGSVSANSFIGTFDGALSSSAQIATNISGAFNGMTGSFLTSIPLNVISSSNQISTEISGAFNGTTSSFVTNPQTASIESNLQSAMTVTLGSDFGGISNGTTFDIGESVESILRKMLVQYQVPTLNSLVISGIPTTLEVGETDTATGGTFTTGSDSNNAPWSLLTLHTGSGAPFNNLTFIKQAISFDNVDLRLTVPGSKTFFLNGTDAEGTTTTTSTDRTDIVSWKNPIFFGGSSNDGTGLSDSVLDTILSDISGSGTGTSLTVSGLVSNDDQALINTTSNTNFPTTFKITLPSSVANALNFTYIVYPASYGELDTVLKNNVQDETGTFGLLGEANHSRHGNEINYNVYKSAGKNAFSTGDSLTLDDV